jgi:hypothetical protein
MREANMTSVTTENHPSEQYLLQRFMRLGKKPEKIVYEFTRDIGLLHQYFRLCPDHGYDDARDVLVARRGRQSVGGGCLTISSPTARKLLPMEKGGFLLADLFPELDLPEVTYGEFSHLVVLPEYSDGAVLPEIARHLINKAADSGAQYVFNIASAPLARSYRQAVQLFGLGWHIRSDIALPDREEYDGVKMVLSILDLTRVTRKKPTKTRKRELAE